MIVRRQGGMTEFIPSPKEKREGLIRDHTLSLLENLHQRLERIERLGGLPLDEARQCRELIERIAAEEAQTRSINEELLAAGECHQPLPE
jgi:hypothetical protein